MDATRFSFSDVYQFSSLLPMFKRLSLLDDISPGTKIPRVANAIIEIPKGTRNKFELDKNTGLIRLDRYLFSSSHYPGDYGFIPQTLAGDGDPLDILVMVSEPTFSGCLIEARIIGLFKMRDHGQADYKILSVPHSDPMMADYHDLADLPSHYLQEVSHFFATYKQLEGIEIEVLGWAPVAEAIEEVKISVDRYIEAHKSK